MIIAQISDTHIVPKGQSWKSLPETKVAERLAVIVKNLNKLNPQPDVIIHTGDAIDEGAHEAYNHLKEILQPLSLPFYIIPGNHDDREAMRAAFKHHTYMPSYGYIQYVIEDHDVRLIALDTVVSGETAGLLCEERVAWLTKTLQQNTQKPTLIFMHHPLLMTGQHLLDKTKCYTPDTFENLIRSFPNIIGMTSGHFHKSCASIFGGTLYFSAPSSAPVHYFETATDRDVKVLELVRPSFVLHKWFGKDHLVSEVIQTLEEDNRLTLPRSY